MSHFTYVMAAYLVSVIVIGGLVCWILIDQRSQNRALEKLEARGVRRRSAHEGKPQ